MKRPSTLFVLWLLGLGSTLLRVTVFPRLSVEPAGPWPVRGGGAPR